MARRVSEESNDSFNTTLTEITDRVKRMPSIAQQIEITHTQTQANLKYGNLGEKIALQKTIMEKKRGPQKTRVRRLNSGAAVETMRSMCVSVNGEEYYILTNGNMIP